MTFELLTVRPKSYLQAVSKQTNKAGKYKVTVTVLH